jgi:hypothetical protein
MDLIHPGTLGLDKTCTAESGRNAAQWQKFFPKSLIYQ